MTLPHPQLHLKICKLVGQPLPAAEWAHFAQYWHPLELAEGDYLTDFDQPEDYFCFVLAGVQRAYFVHEGNEICVGFTYPPDFSGVYDAFLERTPALFAIQALSPSSLLRLHHTDYLHLLDTYPWVERLFRIFNAQMFLAKARHEVAVFTYSAEDRYRRLLKAAPHLFQMVPQKHLASYLSMTPETFSRLRNKVRD